MCNMEMETIWHIDKDITMETRKLLGESVEYAYTLFEMNSSSDKPKSNSRFDERDGSISLDIDNVITLERFDMDGKKYMSGSADICGPEFYSMWDCYIA